MTDLILEFYDDHEPAARAQATPPVALPAGSLVAILVIGQCQRGEDGVLVRRHVGVAVDNVRPAVRLKPDQTTMGIVDLQRCGH